MATSSISGLSSGLQTADMIDQLMRLEAVPQDRLKAQQSTEKSVLSVLRSLNTSASLLGSKAETLAKPATWQTFKATTSGTGVTATASESASAAGFSFTISSLALSHKLGFTEAAALNDVVTSGTSIVITGSDGVEHDVSTGSGTLDEVVTAINSSSGTTGVTATAVKVADGSYRLLAESTTTGTSTSFTLTNDDGSALLGGAAVRAGKDAELDLGLGITATSSTNTFTDIVPGVTLTLGATAAVGGTGTVSVAQDTSSVKSAVSALVDQVNSLLTTIDTQTASKTSTTAAGVLAGDATARSLRNALLNTVFGSDNSSMSSVGIQTDRYGKLVFDSAAFDKAYAADPAGVAAKFTAGETPEENGWSARVAAVAKSASDSTTGSLTSSIAGRNATIDRLTKSIEDWDDRLEVRRSSLERTYTALETALSKMQSQGTWLSSQIASLSTASS